MSASLNKAIEAVFNPRNLDEDCNTIASLLRPYVRRIDSLLKKQDYASAVTLFLEILESLCRHYVRDEHFNYFDDMYSPDYECDNMLRSFLALIEAGAFPADEYQRLKEGLEKVAQTEAFTEYGSPFVIWHWEKFCGQQER